MLYNLLLDKKVDQTVSFADVPGGQWCTTAVRTLASLIILEGYGDGVFAPNAAIIRAEMTAIAKRRETASPGTTTATLWWPWAAVR